MDSAVAAKALRRLMEEISEDRYCAAWRDQLEFHLWQDVLEDTPVSCSREELFELVELAKSAQGWWMWDDAIGDVRFVSWPEWQAYYFDVMGE